MTSSPAAIACPTITLDLVRRWGASVVGMMALIARTFLRMPKFMLITVPLWNRLSHLKRRFERLASGPPPRPRKPTSRTGVAGGKRPTNLPRGKGWLVKALGWEAVAYRSQIEHLLRDPDMRALLAARPGLARCMRPICHMLGVPMPDVIRPAAPVAAEPVAAPAVAPTTAAPERAAQESFRLDITTKARIAKIGPS